MKTRRLCFIVMPGIVAAATLLTGCGDRKNETAGKVADHVDSSPIVIQDESPLPEETAEATPELMADYEAEEFDQVPDWLPRPMTARRAKVEDAVLRSDGLSTGTVNFTMAGDADDTLDYFRERLKRSDLRESAAARDGGLHFEDAETGRVCRIHLSGNESGTFLIAATYEDREHSCGGTCPSCAH